MPRPKGSKKQLFLSNIITTNEFNENRVVINPAVLRYLEQNRNYSDKKFLININEKKDENIFERNIETNHHHHQFLWDFYTYSTEFITTARLAEWILNYH